MSLHGGTFFFDERPMAREATFHSAPGLAMSQPAGDVWIGNQNTIAPDRDARFVLTWDGRLDNGQDLRLTQGSSLPAHATDSQIALAIIERHGLDGLRLLIGDWSVAIWERTARALHLARDYMGARPLYYCQDDRFVAWSANLGELVDRCDRAHALSEAFVAGFMSLRMPGIRTPYDDVRAVPPGTCVSFGPDGIARVHRFWRLNEGLIRDRDRRHYEERLRELWREAVAARLRTAGTVWAELSGGLDSSSIVCMADWLIRSECVQARGLRMVSHATLQSPEGDERRFIAEVERQVGERSAIVGVEETQECCETSTAWVTPYALQGVGLACTRRVLSCGARVVLSGRLGDAVMGCQPDNSVAVHDDFARGHVLAALRKMRAWSRASRKPFLEIAWRLIVPGADREADTGVELLSSRLRAIAADGPPRSIGTVSKSKRHVAEMVGAYSLGARLDIPDRPQPVIYTYPFTHRPLVEFMLAIPGEELSAPGETRSLMRRAFAGFMPPRVLRRVSKGYYPPAAFRAARQLAASLLPVERLEVVERGWIDPNRLHAAIRVLTDGGGATGGDIHCVLRLEKWLQARHERAAIPQRKEVKTNAVLHA